MLGGCRRLLIFSCCSVGGMSCAMGVTMALLERQRSGLGQVIDVSMVDGASEVMVFLFGPFG